MSSSMGSWFSSLGSNISNGFDSIYNWFGDLFDSVGSGFSNVGSWFSDLGDQLSDLLDFKKYFVPGESFMKDYSTQWDNMLHNKFAVVYQIKDSMDAVTSSLQANTTGWDGMQIDLSKYGIGKLDIIDPTAVVRYGEKLKFWIGGLMYFLTGAFLIRKVASLMGEGR